MALPGQRCRTPNLANAAIARCILRNSCGDCGVFSPCRELSIWEPFVSVRGATGDDGAFIFLNYTNFLRVRTGSISEFLYHS